MAKNVRTWNVQQPNLGRDVVRVYVFVGGGKKNLIRYAHRRNCIVLYFDNPKEVEQMLSKIKSPNLICVPINDGETMYEMFARSELTQYADCVANLSTSVGAGATPRVGQEMARHLVGSVSFAEVCAEIHARIIDMTGGRKTDASVLPMSSIGGGVGAGGVVEITDGIVWFLTSKGMRVTVEMDILGAIGFNRLSKHCRERAAALLQPYANAVSGRSFGDRCVVYATFHEAPPMAMDGSRRETCMALEEQARSSASFDDSFSLLAPNLTDTGRFAHHPYKGNILLRQTSVIAHFDSSSVVCPQVARILAELYRGDLKAANDSMVVVQDVDWKSQKSLNVEFSIDQLLTEATNLSADVLERAILTPIQLPDEEIRLVLFDGTTHLPMDLVLRSRSAKRYLSVTLDNMKLLNGFASAMERERDRLVAECDALKRAVASTTSRLHRRHASLFRRFSPIPFSWRWSWFESTARDLRHFSEELNLNEKRLVVCTTALAECKLESIALQDRIEDICATLESHSSTEALGLKKLLILRHHSDVLPLLWDFSKLSIDQQRDILLDCVGGVLDSGLAYLMGLDSPDFGEIAKRIVLDDPEISAPNFGGTPTTPISFTFYSLPSMDLRSQSAIAKAIREWDPGAKVTFCDSHAAGVGIVRMRYSQVMREEDLRRGYLQTALSDAKNAPYSELTTITYEQVGQAQEADDEVSEVEEADDEVIQVEESAENEDLT